MYCGVEGRGELSCPTTPYWGMKEQHMREADIREEEAVLRQFPPAFDDTHTALSKMGGSSTSLLQAPTADTRRRRSFQM
jgi:hypothetical protein